MAYSADQVEKHTLIMRLAVSIYKMADSQILSLLEALEKDCGAMVGRSDINSSSWKNEAIRRQMMLARIFVLINGMDKDALLDKLRILDDPAYRWVRSYPRLACYLSVDFAAQGRAYRSYIRDISASGVFIETGERFQPGQAVALCFTLSEANEPLPFKVRGHVTQVYPDGIGVQYDQMTRYQREILDTLINRIY